MHTAGIFYTRVFFAKEFVSVCEACFGKRADSEEEVVRRERTAFYSICILNSKYSGGVRPLRCCFLFVYLYVDKSSRLS